MCFKFCILFSKICNGRTKGMNLCCLHNDHQIPFQLTIFTMHKWKVSSLKCGIGGSNYLHGMIVCPLLCKVILINAGLKIFKYISLELYSEFTVIFVAAGAHYCLVHYCRGNKSQSVHLHWQIHCRFFSSPRTHEDHPCIDSGILIFR